MLYFPVFLCLLTKYLFCFQKSQVKNESTDDTEDPELLALRKAALLTKKTKVNQNNLVIILVFRVVFFFIKAVFGYLLSHCLRCTM